MSTDGIDYDNPRSASFRSSADEFGNSGTVDRTVCFFFEMAGGDWLTAFGEPERFGSGGCSDSKGKGHGHQPTHCVTYLVHGIPFLLLTSNYWLEDLTSDGAGWRPGSNNATAIAASETPRHRAQTSW